MSGYNTRVPSEINAEDAKILLVGRDPGATEVRFGRPFIGKAGSVLDACLEEAGIERSKINLTNVVPWRPYGNDFSKHKRERVERGQEDLRELIRRLRPNVVVGLGNEASHALIEGWPSRDGSIFGATGIEERRGYIFEGIDGIKVIPSIHPSYAMRVWIPWTALLTKDLIRAKEESHEPAIVRPEREVTVANTAAHAAALAGELSKSEVCSVDIEIYDSERLACIGFSDRTERAFVFPARHLDEARTLLERTRPRKVFANGQFDLHFLLTRCGIRVGGYTDDTQIAWHACYPQLAGKSEQSSAQMTRKSLSFLASLYCRDAYWKDYEFADDYEMYVLNGRDCAITLDIMQQLQPEIDEQGVRSIYEHEIDLVWPCVEMQARGLLVDEQERQRRIEALSEREREINERLNELVVPLLEERSEKLDGNFHLFEQVWTCSCCRNGDAKRSRCWSCAGFDSSPSKKLLVERAQSQGFDHSGMLKADLEAELLGACEECGGEGQRRWLEFNPASPSQAGAVVYDLLSCPPRYEKGSLSVKSEKLRSILPYLN